MVLLASLVLVILILKTLFQGRGKENLAVKYQGRLVNTSRSLIYKYPEADNIYNHGFIWLFGILVALGLAFLGLNNSYQDEIFKIEESFGVELQTDVFSTLTIPNIRRSLPPPPSTAGVKVKRTEKKIENTTEFKDQSNQEETKAGTTGDSDNNEKGSGGADTGTGAGAGSGESNDVYSVVEEAPRFPGCEDKASLEDRRQCAAMKLSQFLSRNVKYPDQAKLKNIQGKVVITFVVEKDGQITGAKIASDIGGGCGEEALRVVNSMNNMFEKWKPGKQRSNPVRVQVNLPITFRFN